MQRFTALRRQIDSKQTIWNNLRLGVGMRLNAICSDNEKDTECADRLLKQCLPRNDIHSGACRVASQPTSAAPHILYTVSQNNRDTNSR